MVKTANVCLGGGRNRPSLAGDGLQGSHEDRVIVIGNTNPSGTGMNGHCYSSEGVNPSLTCNKNEGNRVAIPVQPDEDLTVPGRGFNQRSKIHSVDGISRTLIGSGGGGGYHDGNQPKVAIPVLTPDRAVKRQNGRRFKEDGEEAFTLTGQDRHGVAVEVKPDKEGEIWQTH